MRLLLLLAACTPLASFARPADDVDLAQIERKIGKEPQYVAAPRYALFVLDEAARFRCWAVFDKSTPDAPFYDVLYFDRNGNGDLTEPAERFAGKRDAAMADAGLEMLVKVGDVPVPGTERVHRGLRFSTSPKKGRTGFWFDFRWDGKTEVSGSYGPVGIDTAEFAESAATAAILHPDPNATLSFGLWMESPVKIPVGGEEKLNLIAGHAGLGPNSLAVVDENFIDLDRDELLATVVAKDAQGKEIETTSRIKGHC